MRARSTTGLLMRLLTLVVWLLLLAPFALSGCTSEPPDPRFAEPEATVRTLFTVYDIADVGEAEVQGLLRDRVQFQVRDRAAYEACFADWRDPHDEGLAGFVFGRLAALKDHLRSVPDGPRINVTRLVSSAADVRAAMGEHALTRVVLKPDLPLSLLGRQKPGKKGIFRTLASPVTGVTPGTAVVPHNASARFAAENTRRSILPSTLSMRTTLAASPPDGS